MRLRSLLREPLLHFIALGALLFLWFEWSGGGSGPASTKIVVSPGRIETLAVGFRKTWQRPPTDAELKGLLDEYVREEIATREAMAMGLDLDDTVIRRRLRQKLDFLVEDAVDSVPPTDAELQAWLQEHPAIFQLDPTISFLQVYVSREKREDSAEADARAILRALRASHPDPAKGTGEPAGSSASGVAVDGIGDPTMLPHEIMAESSEDVAGIFGQEFADRIFEIEPGRWAGPVESPYGLHLVLVKERIEGSLPDLAAVRPAVERDLLGERRREQLDAVYERLLEKYTIVIERPEEKPEVAAQ